MRVFLGILVFALACGGSDPVDVVSSTVTGSVDGNELTAVYGVANTLESGTVSIAAGTGELNCGSQESPNPPGSGIYINVQIPVAEVGVPEEHFFNFFIIKGGDLNSRGSNGGTVEVTAVGETLALNLDYSADLDGALYQASGSLEVVLCD